MTANTSVAYACFNIEIGAKKASAEAVTELQALLHDAAIWGGAEDVEVFYSETKYVVGVSIPVEEDPASLLEAGSVLGMCQRTWEESSATKGSSWLSLITPKGEIICSPLGY